MDSEEKRVKKNWSKEETLALLEFYRVRQAEFQHSRRKKFAYAHVLEDMISAGFVEPNTTAVHLEVKMAALMRAYKAAKDKDKHRKAAPCVAPFMKQMDEIFGSSAVVSKIKTISCGSVNFEVCVKNEPPFDSMESSNLSPSRHGDDVSADELPSQQNSSPSNLSQKNFVHPQVMNTLPPALSTSEYYIPADYDSLKPSQAEYFEKRLKQRDRFEKEKSKRWDQYLKIQEEKAVRHREKMDKLDSIINLLLKREC